jgi:hypothetical protein
LGAYQDLAPLSEEVANSEMMQQLHKESNYESFELSKVIAREFPMPIVTWNSTSASGANLTSYVFPDILFSEPFIAAKISDFSYFRAAIRMTFRVVSNQFFSGKLLANFVPNTNYNQTGTLQTSVYSMSGFNHVLLDAKAGDAVIFDIPFVYYFRYLSLNTNTSSHMGTVYLNVMNPLQDVSTGTACSAQVFVTAQFIDPELYIPFSPNSLLLQNFDEFVPHSTLDEAKEKSEKGVISSTLDATSDVSAMIGRVPFMKPYADIFRSVAKPASSMFKMFGLNKPTTLAMTQISKINPFMDLNTFGGVDTSLKLAGDPENRITTDPVTGGQTVDEMDLSYIAGVPMWVNTFPVLQSSVGLPGVPISDMNFSQACYCDYICNFFDVVTGTWKFKFYITASQFQSVRLVFWLNQTSATSHWENCYHQIVDVQGSTDVEMSIPYMLEQPATGADYANPMYLLMSVLSFNQPDLTLNVPIYVNVYKAMSNAQFFGLLDVSFQPQCNPRSDFAKEFPPIHASAKPFNIHNVIYGDEYRSLREVLHRYWFYYQTSQAGIEPLVYDYNYKVFGTSTTKYISGIEAFGQLFLFYRGSIRLKFIQGDNVARNIFVVKGDATAAPVYVGSAVSCTTNPLIEIEIPYYYNSYYCLTRQQTGYNQPLTYVTSQPSGGNTTFLCKAAGDDFSFMHLAPPPPGAFLPNPQYTTAGPSALAVFLGSAK